VLYYVLGDAGGQSALFADSIGQEVGRIWYDPLGGVIQNTLPATLTEKLTSHLDTATGLQYDGLHYYDPWVGTYIQPNPFGGAPEASGTRSRYGVVSSRAADQAQARAYAPMPDLALFGPLAVNIGKAGSKWVIFHEAVRGLRSVHRNSRQVTRLVDEVGYLYFRHVPSEAADSAISYYLGRSFRSLGGGNYKSASQFRRVALEGGLTLYQNVDTGVYDVSLGYLMVRLEQAGLGDAAEFVAAHDVRSLVSKSPVGRVAGWLALTKTGQHVLDLGFGLGIDVGVQGIIDLGMLTHGELTPGQYAGRLGVAAFGSGVSWAAGQEAAYLAATYLGASLGGPIGIGIGIGVAIIYDVAIQPLLYKQLGLNP
jgi:hypothetical protein